VLRGSFLDQEFGKPHGQFGVCEPRIHVLTANRGHQVRRIPTKENPALAVCPRHEAVDVQTASPELASPPTSMPVRHKLPSEISVVVFLMKKGSDYISSLAVGERKRFDGSSRGKIKPRLLSPAGSIFEIPHEKSILVGYPVEWDPQGLPYRALPAIAAQRVFSRKVESPGFGKISADGDMAVFFGAIGHLMTSQKTNRRMRKNPFFQQGFRPVLGIDNTNRKSLFSPAKSILPSRILRP
jgi:hypothetical protein